MQIVNENKTSLIYFPKIKYIQTTKKTNLDIVLSVNKCI